MKPLPYPVGTNSVEINLIVSQPLYIFKTFTVAENVVSNVEDMVGFEIWIVQLEKMKMAIDSFVQFQPLDQHLHGPYATIEYATVTIGDVIMDITRIEHWPGMFRQRSFVKAIANFPFALSQFFCYFLSHSK